MASSWKGPSRMCMQGLYQWKVTCNLNFQSVRGGTEAQWDKRCCQAPRALWECQNGTSTLWLSAAFCRMHIPRTVRLSQQSSITHSCVSCFLVLCLRRLCCGAQDELLGDTKSWLHVCPVKSMDINTRKCKELLKKWRLQVIASFSNYSVDGPLSAKIRVKTWSSRLSFGLTDLQARKTWITHWDWNCLIMQTVQWCTRCCLKASAFRWDPQLFVWAPAFWR